jgi:acyl carrier protein
VYESDNFIDDGLDRLDIIRLVAMLEETFDVNIDGMDIVPENFENAEAIANLLRRKGHEI